MAGVSVRAPDAGGVMERMLSRLQNRLQNAGLNLAAYDGHGKPLGPFAPASALCRELHGAACGGPEQMAELVCQTLSRRQAALAICPCGGCLMAIPVFRRRRVLGVMAAGFPTREALEEGSLRKLCQRLGADWAHVEPLARAEVRHSRRSAPHLLEGLSWILELQQAAEVARAETENLSANLASTYEELSLLYRISGSMKVTQSPGEFLTEVCRDLQEVMPIAAAAAVVFAPAPAEQEDLVIVAGSPGLEEPAVRALAREQLADRLDGNRPILDNDVRDPTGTFPPGAVRRLIAAPMLTDARRLGVLIGFNKLQGDFDSVDLKLISSVANQVAVFLANHRLYAELQDLLMGVLHALTASIDAKDPYTSGHSSRVAVLSRLIAQRLGYDGAAVQRIYLTGLLHDIGKIGVPEQVLRKPGRLTEEEFELIKAHPSIGARILGGIRQLDHVVEGILTHHERPDGSGYPRGLAGEQVPREGRIIGLADAFDAMTSDRTYRKAMPLEQVLAEIRRQSGTQFDPQVVDTFLSLDLDRLMEELRQPAGPVLPIRSLRELSR